MGEEDALSEHALETSLELDFRDGKGMAEMQGAVGVGEGEVSEPLGEPLADLRRRETLDLVRGGRVDLEELLGLPAGLVLAFELADLVPLAGLGELDGVGRGGGGRGGHGARTRQTSGTESASQQRENGGDRPDEASINKPRESKQANRCQSSQMRPDRNQRPSSGVRGLMLPTGAHSNLAGTPPRSLSLVPVSPGRFSSGFTRLSSNIRREIAHEGNAEKMCSRWKCECELVYEVRVNARLST